jgi:predicted Zn-dependent protease
MKPTYTVRTLAVAVTVVVLLSLAACAINPATGKRQLVLVSEDQELQLGKENDRAVLGQFGVYDDPELQAYVQEIGDSGYIYLTRGILAHFNSEAEMASVLGHEIGHVTARHSVNQMSKAQLAGGLLNVGMLVNPDLQALGGVAQAGLGLAFLKFGRDDERQADDLGLRYLMKARYDPRPMANVFTTLKRVGNASGGEGPPAWASTHPDPERREERTLETIRQRDRDFSSATVRRDEYLSKIDGIAFGDDPRQGYFEGARFRHPEMRFQVEFPEGWKTANQRQAVLGMSGDKQAMLQLTLARQSTPEAALRKFMSQQGVNSVRTWSEQVNSLPAEHGSFTAALSSGTAVGQVSFVAYDGQVFQILGFGGQSEWGSHRSKVQAAMASFRPLTDPDALSVQPQRLRIVRPETTMALEEFAQYYSVTVPSRQLIIINGMARGESFRAGVAYKVVQGGTLPGS